ncbi:MAG: lipoyl synthase [Thermodesulfobacteriota bacterium]
MPKPPWLRRRIPEPGRSPFVARVLSDLSLHTVCQEAQCPNQGECYGRGTATFLLLGPGCTRRCAFCAVTKGPSRPDPDEPEAVAEAAWRLELVFCVLTMVTRDDLADGGAAHMAAAVRAIKNKRSEQGVEVLISDLKGDPAAIDAVMQAGPEVLNHNLETVPRLYPHIRPQADYRRSLAVLAQADRSGPRPVTKSGLMLGLGETMAEVLQVMEDLRAAGCDLITLGQYLAPSSRHAPVARYIEPAEFKNLEREASRLGFLGWAAGPYVRSSYGAADLFRLAAGRRRPRAG